MVFKRLWGSGSREWWIHGRRDNHDNAVVVAGSARDSLLLFALKNSNRRLSVPISLRTLVVRNTVLVVLVAFSSWIIATRLPRQTPLLFAKTDRQQQGIHSDQLSVCHTKLRAIHRQPPQGEAALLQRAVTNEKFEERCLSDDFAG
jgi:hypothetical protein